MASTPPHLLLHDIVFFGYHSDIYNVNITFLANAPANTLFIWVYIPCQDLYLRKTDVVSILF